MSNQNSKLLIEVYHGLPYNCWQETNQKGGLRLPSNPFENFRITKGNFMIQVITERSGETNITIKLPADISFTI